jgi:predicted CXXCH cytochrome family protein
MKKLLVIAGLVVGMITLAAMGLGLYLEARFRPLDDSDISVAADTGYLRGRVTRPAGWLPFLLPGIAGSQVSLTPGGQHTTSDDDGFFAIPNLTPGVYSVRIEAAGSETAVLDGIAVAGGMITTLPDEALFASAQGPPVARLKIGSLAPFGGPPDIHPYGAPVYLDASGSKNISRDGIRFEIRDGNGELLTDPNSGDAAALQPEKSAIPGIPPTLYAFEPPVPDTYTVTLFLSNDETTDRERSAEVTLRAVNTPPEAVPRVIAGPEPPRKQPSQQRRSSSGLNVILLGEPVYLMGTGIDRNHAAPERYNPGGITPDLYGKNHDHLQRQFDFHWQLFYLGRESGSRQPVDRLLRNSEEDSADAGQVLHFNADRPGRYEAVLTVSDNDPFDPLTSDPVTIPVLVVDDATTRDGSECVSCHPDRVAGYSRSPHAQAGIGCERCHGPAAAHLAAESADKKSTQSLSLQSGVCGQCHEEFGEWEKSRHADGLPYGYLEIAPPLLVQCSKCHYARTFARTVEAASDAGTEFHDVNYKRRVAGIGPLMADLSRLPGKAETGLSCVACHDPHEIVAGQSVGIRTATAGALCQTCHEEKWQNTVLEGTAGEVRNGYEYPGDDYGARNPHATPAKCVRCHLGDQTGVLDARRVRAVGGHTLRMRDAGANGILGGFGPRADDPGRNRDPEDNDDILHLAACRTCHRGLENFDRHGFQSAIYARWNRLGELLKAANYGVLPDFRPGDKCATCHRGGTLPFDDDPQLHLENAYTNYKLVRNDRSWGIHNPEYVKKLLEDSIAAVEAYLGAIDGTAVANSADDVR